LRDEPDFRYADGPWGYYTTDSQALNHFLPIYLASPLVAEKAAKTILQLTAPKKNPLIQLFTTTRLSSNKLTSWTKNVSVAKPKALCPKNMD
jgi:hypothetical protein